MGVFIDYSYAAACSEEELCARLERVRQRCLDLPFRSVGVVEKIEAVHSSLAFILMEREGHALPEAVAKRLKECESRDPYHGDKCLSFALDMGLKLPRKKQERYFAPALDFIKNTDLWKAEDLPESLSETIGDFKVLEIQREYIALQCASVMIRRGYRLSMDPGPRCETFKVALDTYGKPAGDTSRGHPFWYGNGFTKTQYAEEFIRAHETICRALDIVREERLLLCASDTCGYYKTRSWKDAAKIVNDELLFARLMGDVVGLAVGNLREEGVSIQTVVDNASTAQPVDFTSVLSNEAQSNEPDDEAS